MAQGRKNFSSKFAGGHKPSEERKNEVKSAIHQEKDIQEQHENQAALSKLDERKALLKEEADKIEALYTPFKTHRNMAIQEKMAQLVGYASTEFGINQKKLIAIALHRLFQDLKEDSTFLKMYL